MLVIGWEGTLWIIPNSVQGFKVTTIRCAEIFSNFVWYLQGVETGTGRQDRPDLSLYRDAAASPSQVPAGPGQDVQPPPHPSGNNRS